MTRTPIALSLDVLEKARAGSFGEIRDMFAPQLRTMVTSEVLEAAWTAALESHGLVASLGEPIAESTGAGMVIVKVPVTFEHGALTVVISVTDAGWLAGLQLAPASALSPPVPWEAPPYVDETTYDEREVVLGSGQFVVSGTLSLPHGDVVHPAVVLLAGSGLLDRDETIGPNKPLKDIAWGLASRGVAVLRFDKVTLVHPDEVRAKTDFTVADEYVPHAVEAFELLRQHPGVDPERIFLLGHSLGGTVAPRIAAKVPTIAGIVIMAGGAEPLQWAIVRQLRYLASLDPATAAASEANLETLVKQATLVDSPVLSASTPSSDLPLGVPATYWLDLRDYEPVTVAASLDRPILLVQGERDYQVTVADDLKRWTAGLRQRANVTVRVYPADNHMFFSGSGPSSPSEYEAVQHVDSAVVADVADWLLAGGAGASIEGDGR